MKNLMAQLTNDETGFIVSAELVLVATIAVLSMVVGLSEVSHNINQELEDVGSAFGSINQSFSVSGLEGYEGWISGSSFYDGEDFCDNECDITQSDPQNEH